MWLGMLSQIDTETVSCAFGAFLLGLIYPFAKQVTDYPQVVLDFTHSWDGLVGCVSRSHNIVLS